MNYLSLHTEHSYQYAVGRLNRILCHIPEDRVAITDRSGTWGHVKWADECKKVGKVPLFGVELAVVPDMELREKQQASWMTFIAHDNTGLRELYELVTLATEKFYYIPRIDYGQLRDVSSHILTLSGPSPDWDRVPKKLKSFFVSLAQTSVANTPERAKALGYKLAATVDNLYPRPEDRNLYEMVTGEGRQSSTLPRHILHEWEWKQEWPEHKGAIDTANKLAKECNATLPFATLIHPKVTKTLRQMCLEGAKRLGLDVKGAGPYRDRMEMELKLIAEKKFEDYFFVVADMVVWAKKRMLVGPARGSSCGSLVCYLLSITDIDPLPHDLLFERFIDINRKDLPDVDIDFQMDRRELVFDYVKEKYGKENVARLGTVNVFKPKSAISLVSKQLDLPSWEVQDLKDAIVERSSGDARAAFCIADTFEQLEIGRTTLAKYPELGLSAELEAHASHTGMHAAGIVITADPVTNFCAINENTQTAMIDKHDAETLGLLKIDALGLRTLSIVQDTLDQIGMTYEEFRLIPKDDPRAFALLNEKKYVGIFQFEGYALQSLAANMRIEELEDVISLTALARPGPFESGAANEFIKRRAGQSKVTYLHPLCKDITKVSHGVVVYQEQVMQIARTVGALSWEDVSTLRKAMSKSFGKEYFNQFWDKFWEGAKTKMSVEEARKIWDSINSMGSWAFNRSHAVAYGTVSYWCLWLKAHRPLEFAAAILRNAKDDDQSVKVLRELSLEGYKYRPYDRHLSAANWSVQNGVLVGGLMAIKGVGAKLAETILRKREAGTPFSPREEKLLSAGVTPWDQVFECAERWGHIIRSPLKYGIESRIVTTDTITQDSNGEFVFIAKLREKNLRDHNELKLVDRRKGKRMTGPTAYLNLVLEDDTGSIMANISRWDYARYGLPIIEEGKIDEWYLWKGSNRAGFRRVNIQRWKKLSGNQEFMPGEKKSKKDVDCSSKKDHRSAVDRNTGERNKKPKTKKPKQRI